MLLWNRFRNTSLSDQKFYFEYNFLVETKRLSLFKTDKKKLGRSKLIWKLHIIGWTNREISDFLNSSKIKQFLTNKQYTPKSVWGMLNNYKKRLNRRSDKIIWIKESLKLPFTKDIIK